VYRFVGGRFKAQPVAKANATRVVAASNRQRCARVNADVANTAHNSSGAMRDCIRRVETDLVDRIGCIDQNA
jgi:hypothetical protein